MRNELKQLESLGKFKSNKTMETYILSLQTMQKIHLILLVYMKF